MKAKIKAWAKKNYKFFAENIRWRGYWPYVIHHGIGRTGILTACLHTYRALTNAQYNDPEVLKVIRDNLNPDKEKIFQNFDRISGCKEPLFKACKYCACLIANQEKK